MQVMPDGNLTHFEEGESVWMWLRIWDGLWRTSACMGFLRYHVPPLEVSEHQRAHLIWPSSDGNRTCSCRTHSTSESSITCRLTPHTASWAIGTFIIVSTARLSPRSYPPLSQLWVFRHEKWGACPSVTGGAHTRSINNNTLHNHYDLS